jgi:hypothetical protein
VTGFSFQINYPVLRYLAVCVGALIGALAAAVLSGGDMTWVIIGGVICYIIGRIAVWVIWRE